MLAVAGAGKTTYLIGKLNEEENFIIITYTNNNYNSIRNAIINKFSYIPKNIKLYTYFSFLYNYCYRPFEREVNSKGLQFGNIMEKRANSKQLAYYMNTKSKKMYAGRLAKLCEIVIDKIIDRIEKYNQYLFIDEIQDFAGNDFNFIKKLTKCNINILYVGDFYQHTFDTSRDNNTNINLFNNYKTYVEKLCNGTLKIDNNTLIKSRRCTKNVCDFIRENLDIDIYSYDSRESEIKEITDEKEIEEMMSDNSIKKLFYRKSDKYIGNTGNWGDSKGITYKNVCVILNQTTYKLFKENKLKELATMTKNKFYVACTRTKNNLYFISEKSVNRYVKE